VPVIAIKVYIYPVQTKTRLAQKNPYLQDETLRFNIEFFLASVHGFSGRKNSVELWIIQGIVAPGNEPVKNKIVIRSK
jgi:hypothetical protein